MEKTACGKNGAHVLVFPYPAQGHMLPLLDLTHQLSQRNLSITILITPGNLPILTPLLSANPSIQTLILPFPNSPFIPEGIENIKDLGNRGNIPMINALTELQELIIQWFGSHCNPPVAILSDFFLGWTYDLACKLQIPRITFYCSGAIFAAVSDHLWGDPEAVVKLGLEVKFKDLPGSPCLTWEELPTLFRRYKELEVADSNFELVKNSMIANTLSWGLVFNSFMALEGEFLDYLSEKMGHQRVYAVGPLHLLGEPSNLGSNPTTNRGVLSWLDECEDGSVLYVCFGSQKLLKKTQMEALASGLEKSGVKFVWAVKKVTAQQVADGFGPIPDGFEDRLAGRGFVIKGWAPQSAILSHRAVGGFLSHCGWNSVLEAVASGVMILCWPMEADQYLDDKLMADYQKAAVRVCKGRDMVPDTDELARKIIESMHGDVVERITAKELRDKAVEAVKIGGSSYKCLDELAQELAKL